MLTYNLVPSVEASEVLDLLNQDTADYREWWDQQCFQNLDHRDLEWVLTFGMFKCAYQQVRS